jgi:DNA-binding IscR family transcriptional regulator
MPANIRSIGINFRRDVIVAWDLLHVLSTDEFQKLQVPQYALNTKYGLKVSEPVLKRVSWRLAQAGLIESKKGAGFRAILFKQISILDVFAALGIKPQYRTDHPAGRAMGRVDDCLLNITMEKGR